MRANESGISTGNNIQTLEFLIHLAKNQVVYGEGLEIYDSLLKNRVTPPPPPPPPPLYKNTFKSLKLMKHGIDGIT